MKKGNPNSPILVLGEAPGQNEIQAGVPFTGASGQELERMLREAKFEPESLYYANVCNERPPDGKIDSWFPTSKKKAQEVGAKWENGMWVCSPVLRGLMQLEETISSMPNLQLIVALGNVPLWATTGEWGITKWRGSQMPQTNRLDNVSVVPTYHPANILRQWENRWIAVEDLKRAKDWFDTGLRVPDYEFAIHPSFSDSCAYVRDLLAHCNVGRVRMAVDLETRARHIACIGLADSPLRAICIPFMTMDGPYFSEGEEISLIWNLYQLLTHPNCEVIGQNYLYDRQYIARRWGFRSNLFHDTMVKHHLAFPGVPKGLDFLSSIHNKYHCYWKDESKDWEPSLGESQLWTYNCKDAVATFEANDHLDSTIHAFGLERQLTFQMETAEIAFDMMLRGIKVNVDYKMDLHEKLVKLLQGRLDFIKQISGINLEPSSPKQVQKFCYDVLKLPPVWKHDKKSGLNRLTADKEAVEEWLLTCDPLYRPLLQAIVDYRSLTVYNSTFALARLDNDGRFRCSINVAGPETFRWSTSEDAFGFGTNMQNIPRPEDD